MGRSPKIGLALGSGGARGWCHLGVLSVLDDLGIRPDIIAGCSMGAVVGAAEAGGKRADLLDWALNLTQARFMGLVDIRPSSGGLIAGKQIANVLAEFDLDVAFDALQKPFTAVATDLETGREIWLDKGSLLPAIRASVAIPGLFAPQRLDHRWLIDGGVTNPVPASVCRARGADVIIAVNPNAKPDGKIWQADPDDGMLSRLQHSLEDALPAAWRPAQRQPGDNPPQGFEVAGAAIDILTEYLRRTRAAADPADVVIDVNLSTFSILSFDQAATAIDTGRDAALAQSDKLTDLCRALP
jgi:NTE family protein